MIHYNAEQNKTAKYSCNVPIAWFCRMCDFSSGIMEHTEGVKFSTSCDCCNGKY